MNALDISHSIRTYTAADISDDKKSLQITLDKQLFLLPLVNVGNEEKPTYIAWLDTHPDHADVPEGISHAAAVERADLILEMERKHGQDVTTIVTPDSSKSIPSIQETVDIVSHSLKKHINFIILPGGKNENEVAKQSAIAPVAYRNITSANTDKFLGITGADIEIILQHNHQGKGILEIDDVYTTGGTDNAVQKILNTILHLPDTARHPLIVLARESEYDETYPYKVPDHVFANMNLPEFTHGFHN